MLPLEIEILWNTDKTTRDEAMGIDSPLQDFDTRTVTFFNIDVITPNHWDKKFWLCNIWASGERFLCPYTYEEVKKMIEESIK